MLEVNRPAGELCADKLRALVLDWAGTVVDFGSRAPVMAILTAFEKAGVPVAESEARRPMGRAKRDHLHELLNQPDVAARWREKHGRDSTTEDLEEIYATFLAAQAASVAEFSPVIPGCCEAIEECRRQGLKIGSSTGYTRDLLEAVARRAESEGFKPDVMLSADDISPGRPAPWLIFENCRRLNVYPMSAVAKVDDTMAGITAGRNAGAWTIGVVASGNEVGLSKSAFDELSDAERAAKMEAASQRLITAGAHFLIDTIAELPAAVAAINQKLAARISPPLTGYQ